LNAGMSHLPGAEKTFMSHLGGPREGGGTAGGLVDLLQEPDEMPAGDAEFERGTAPVAAIAGEGGEHFLTLQHVDLPPEPRVDGASGPASRPDGGA